MWRRSCSVLACLAFCALTGLFARGAHAETILKLSLGDDDPPDVEYAGGIFSTVDDGEGGTTGDQDTTVLFQGFLAGFSDIIDPPGSFTLAGLTAVGSAIVIADLLVIQDFEGGILELYDADNDLLLSGALDDSALAGPLGGAATGALFTTTFGTVTGGTLAPLIDPDTLTLSMSLTDVNDGAGLSAPGEPPVLGDFTADVTLNIAAQQIPEPATALLLVSGAALAVAFGLLRRRRRNR